MAARIRKIQHDEDTRAKIKVGNIITRIQGFALARTVITQATDGAIHINYVDEDNNPVWPMTREQVAVAKLLLDKALPNLTSVDVKSDETKTYVLRAPPPENNVKDWMDKYGPKTIEHKPAKKTKA